MLLIIGTVRLPPEKRSEARPVMRAMVENSRAEDGCVEYGYAEDVLDPGLIHVKEIWRDQLLWIDISAPITWLSGAGRGLAWGSGTAIFGCTRLVSRVRSESGDSASD